MKAEASAPTLMKLSGTEYEVMSVIWDSPGITAQELESRLAAKGISYGTNLYSYLNRCQKKGAVKRVDPGYHCWPLIEKSEASHTIMEHILNTLFHGSPAALVETLVKDEKLSDTELKQIRDIINRIDSDGK